MNDRIAILSRIRSAVAHSATPPPAFQPPDRPSSWEAFEGALRLVGGEVVGPVGIGQLAEATARLCAARSAAGRIVAAASARELLGAGPWESIPESADPHSLADVQVAIVRGSLGVAENGAVAVEGAHAPVRALLFLSSHLVLLLDASSIVADMHRAVEQMTAGFTSWHHYTWISGPSKTADIEQTVVLGAHGPRSLIVIGVRADGLSD